MRFSVGSVHCDVEHFSQPVVITDVFSFACRQADSVVKIDARLQELIGAGFDLSVRVRTQFGQQRNEKGSLRRFGPAVRQLGEHPARRDHRAGVRLEKRHGLRMGGIVGVRQREEVEGVRENGLHDLGVP